MRTAADTDGVRAELAAVPAAERVALVDPRFVGHQHSLRLALTDPRFPAGAVPGALSVRPEARGALNGALSAVTSHTGARTVPAAASTAPAAAPVPYAMQHAAQDAGPHTVRGLPDAVADTLDADALATDGLGAEDTGGEPGRPGRPGRPGGPAHSVPVHRPALGALVAVVPADESARAQARARVDDVDDEAIRLRSAVKSRDGFFTTFCISPYSRYLARWCARRRLTPNHVTTASLVTALVAATCAATGARGGFVAAGVLLLASFVLDATDGQLARYDLQYSTLGAWLDATFDRAKEYAYYAGLALGAARADGGDDVWALALGAMVLQTVRHVVDFAFTEANQDATANTSPTAALSGRLDRVGWTVWLRRMIVLPIGERWALIAVLTACTTPRITLVVLLVGCALAACYTTAGRLLRSLARRADRTERAARALTDLADGGPLGELFTGAFRRLRLAPPGLARPALALAAAAGLLAVDYWTPLGSWWPVLATAGYALVSGLVLTARRDSPAGTSAGTPAGAPLTGVLDWLVPPLFRMAEYTAVLALAARSGADGALPAAFGLVAAVAYHHYDTVYRIRGGTGAPPRRLVRAIGGHEGRTLLVAVAAALWAGAAGGPRGDSQGFPLALTALAVVIVAVAGVESIRFWVSSTAPAVHDETGEPA